MTNITTVNLTAGVPTGPAGASTVSTIDALMADGGQATLGAQADAVVAAGAAGTIGAKLRAISRDIVANIVLAAGANVIGAVTQSGNWVIAAGSALIGKVGIDQTTPGTTNLVATTARAQLLNTGTSNGSIISPLALTAGSDLASLANGSAVTLTGGGASGVSSQSNTGSAKRGIVVFQTVTAGFTPTAGGCISIWWLNSPDGGTTYENTPATPSTSIPALYRPPDCIIPLDVAALGTSALKYSYPCKLPEGTFKVLVQNNSGAAFGAGNYTLKLIAFAENN